MSYKNRPVAAKGPFYRSFSLLILVVDNPQTCVRVVSFCAENINDSALKIRSDKMPRRNRKNRIYRALTIMEMVMAMVLITIVFAAVLPQFRVINNSWDSKQGNAEVLQNGRVLMDHVSRNLSKAVRIKAVSDSGETNGYIEFEDNDGNDLRYEIIADNYVGFGPVGNLSDLAGPVSSLQFTCYDDNDLDTSITDVNSIRFVNVQATLINSASLARDKTFIVSAYLRTNAASSACDSNIVAWWKLDETSGLTAEDSSGNGNEGSLMNMVGDEWTGGAMGGALNFDGNNDYVAIQNLYYDGSGYEEVTVAAWIRTSNSGNQIIASYDRNEYWRLEINGNGGGSGQIGWDVRTSAGQVDYGSVTRVDDDQWHHVAGVFDNGTLIIYIDGNPEPSTSGGGTFGRGIRTRYGFLGVGSEATTFDGNRGPNNYFDGDMDDVRIYNRALSQVEIAQLASIIRYRGFREAKESSDTASITIDTPADTNEGDLLIAAVATDGDTSISPPAGEGWTEINVDDYSSEVTLGAWWKLAEASESSSHQFSWAGSEKAYGWIMRFTGHDTTEPIDVWASAGGSGSTPSSPAVTTTGDNCMILRLGAFDDDGITVDAPGLTGHTAITMDTSGGSGAVLFQDGFETGFDNWTTNWELSWYVYHSGSWSAEADRWDDDLTSDDIDTSAYSSFTIEFWYGIINIDDNDDVYLQLFDGSDYDDYFEIGDQPEGVWLEYEETITDAQYLHSDFRIRINGSSIDNNEYLWVDDVVVSIAGSGTVSGGAGYILQSDSGDSGTSTFTLNPANEAQMITIAIAPAVYTGLDGCSDSILP